MVEGIRALYINLFYILTYGSPTEGVKDKEEAEEDEEEEKEEEKEKEEEEEEEEEYLFFNLKTIYMKYENIIINFKTIISTTF